MMNNSVILQDTKNKLEKCEELLSALLGYSNFELLYECKLPLDEIIEENRLNYEFSNIRINDIIEMILFKGCELLKDKISEIISNLESKYDLKEITVKELKIYRIIKDLNIDEDFEPYANVNPPYITFKNNLNIYKKYFKNEIKEIEDLIGFKIGD